MIFKIPSNPTQTSLWFCDLFQPPLPTPSFCSIQLRPHSHTDSLGFPHHQDNSFLLSFFLGASRQGAAPLTAALASRQLEAPWSWESSQTWQKPKWSPPRQQKLFRQHGGEALGSGISPLIPLHFLSSQSSTTFL